MSEMQLDDPLFDYNVYRFGRSRQVFRGPKPNLNGHYLAFLGGSYTFGRYTDYPFPSLISEEFAITSINLGTHGAGPGFFLGDPEVKHAASNARLCVVEVMNASSISNRMFTVRPRRNVRLHDVSDLMRGIFPEVEFDRFAFVFPMLRFLKNLDPERFKLVENEMKNAWIGRTQTLLSSLHSPTILLWFSTRTPDDLALGVASSSHAGHPHYVDRAMIDTVKDAADGYVECVTQVGLPQNLQVDGRTVLFRPSGMPINENKQYPSPEMHEAAADALAPEIKRLLLG